MNIGSGAGYPASALSNFCPYRFTFDGVECNSMEGFLQSLKFSNPDMQEHVCTLVGVRAKYKGKNKKWWKTQTLYWKGVEYKRDSEEYQQLLDGAYVALLENTKFQRALLATGSATLKHSIGKTNQNQTILTVREFCSRLTQLRRRLQIQQNENKLFGA